MSRILLPSIGCIVLTLIVAIISKQIIIDTVPIHAWTNMTKTLPLKQLKSIENIQISKFPLTKEGRRALATSTLWFNPDFFVNIYSIQLGRDPVILELPSANELYFDIEMLNHSGKLIKHFGTSDGHIESSNYLLFGPSTRNRSISGISKVNVDTDVIHLISRIRILDPESFQFAHLLDKNIQLLPFGSAHWGSRGRARDTHLLNKNKDIPEKQKFLAYQEKLHADTQNQQLNREDIKKDVNNDAWGKNTKDIDLDEVRAELELLGINPDTVLEENDKNEKQTFKVTDPSNYLPANNHLFSTPEISNNRD